MANDQDGDPSHADHGQRLDSVIAQATRMAAARGAAAVRTGDMLRAVTTGYGVAFQRALRAHEYHHNPGPDGRSARSMTRAEPAGADGAPDSTPTHS